MLFRSFPSHDIHRCIKICDKRARIDMKIFGMNILNRRSDPALSSTSSPLSDFWYLPIAQYIKTASGITVTPETALQLSAVFACVNVVATSISTLPLLTYKNLPERGRLRDYNHSLSRIFTIKPHPFMSVVPFKAMMMCHLMLRGNAYCQIVMSQSGEILALTPLHPDRVKPKINEAKEKVYEYTPPLS